MLDLCLADSRIFYFWYVLESIHKFTIELHVQQCLFTRRSNKKQRRVRIISNFAKGETFHLLWQPSAIGGNLTMWPLLHPSKKAFLSPFILAKKTIYLETQLKGELTDLFRKLAGCSLFPRVGIRWWTLL